MPPADTTTCLENMCYHFSGLLGFSSVKLPHVSTTGQWAESVRTKRLGKRGAMEDKSCSFLLLFFICTRSDSLISMCERDT